MFGGKMNKMSMQGMMDKMFSAQFAKVDNIAWDLMSGLTGIKSNSGIYTLAGDQESGYGVSLNPMDFMSMELPAFAMATPIEQINLGDIVFSASNAVQGWVVKKSESGKSFEVMKPDGTVSRWIPPKVNVMGGVTGPKVVRNIFGDPNAMGAMQGIMPMLMMSGMMDDDGKSGDSSMMEMMITMQLMQAMSGGQQQNGMNMMGNMMPMMMMAQMLKK